MFKVLAPSGDSPNVWEIQHIESGQIVGTIVELWNGNKELRVKDIVVGSIATQKEALEKLSYFFAGNLKETEIAKKLHIELSSDLSVVQGQYSYNLLSREIQILGSEIAKLEKYNLY